MTDIAIRDAIEGDLDAMRAILNKEIRETTATWTTVERSARSMRKWWMDLRRDGYPTLVATEVGRLLGYAAYDGSRDNGGLVALFPDGSPIIPVKSPIRKMASWPRSWK